MLGLLMHNTVERAKNMMEEKIEEFKISVSKHLQDIPVGGRTNAFTISYNSVSQRQLSK